MAPFTSPKSGRSLGEKNWEITSGFSPAPTFSVARGFSENFDAGALAEYQLFPQVAVWGKYSLINTDKRDYAVALYGGLFQALDLAESQGFFAGPIISYKKKWFETYFVIRYNYVDWDPIKLTANDKDDSLFDSVDWDAGSLDYMQYTFGMNFWFTDGFALNLSGQYWSFFENGVHTDSVIPGIELIWHF